MAENGLETTYQKDYSDAKSTTQSIISGYGVGPTDENGKPLFGLKALRTSNDGKLRADEGTLKRRQVRRRAESNPSPAVVEFVRDTFDYVHIMKLFADFQITLKLPLNVATRRKLPITQDDRCLA